MKLDQNAFRLCVFKVALLKKVLLCFHITLVCCFQLLYYLASLLLTTTNHIHMTSYVSHFIQYHILCTFTNVNIGIRISKTAPETYVAKA